MAALRLIAWRVRIPRRSPLPNRFRLVFQLLALPTLTRPGIESFFVRSRHFIDQALPRQPRCNTSNACHHLILAQNCRTANQESWISRETSGDDHAGCGFSERCCIGRRAWCCWRCCWGERRLTRIKFVLFKSRRLLQRPSPKAKASRSWQPRRRRNIQL